jgi:pyruvate-formate lyase
MIRTRSSHSGGPLSTLSPSINLRRHFMRLRLALAVAAVATTATPLPVAAHPTDIPFATRGECEAAYAAASKDDRDALVSAGIFKNTGQFQKGVRDLFQCEYIEEEQAWYIVYIGPPGGPG